MTWLSIILLLRIEDYITNENFQINRRKSLL